MFPDGETCVDEEFLKKAGSGEYCFLENIPIPEDADKIESVLIYRWDRRYPSTAKFSRKLLAGKELVETGEFPGYSHEKITMERYR